MCDCGTCECFIQEDLLRVCLLHRALLYPTVLDLVKDYIVDVWVLKKARLYDKNFSVPRSQCQNSSGELGGVWDRGRLRCLHGKVDTTISCMCTCRAS